MKLRPEELEPAFPLSNHLGTDVGLSKIEYFTAMAMQGLLAAGFRTPHNMPELAKEAVYIAGHTLAALKEVGE